MKFLLGVVVGAVGAGIAFDWLLKNSDMEIRRYGGEPEPEPPKDDERAVAA